MCIRKYHKGGLWFYGHLSSSFFRVSKSWIVSIVHSWCRETYDRMRFNEEGRRVTEKQQKLCHCCMHSLSLVNCKGYFLNVSCHDCLQQIHTLFVIRRTAFMCCWNTSTGLMVLQCYLALYEYICLDLCHEKLTKCPQNLRGFFVPWIVTLHLNPVGLFWRILRCPHWY